VKERSQEATGRSNNQTQKNVLSSDESGRKQCFPCILGENVN
jgi:hypothetical protein